MMKKNPLKGGMTEREDSETLIRGLEIGAVIFLVGAIAAALYWAAPSVAMGIAASGLITLIQFRLLQRMCRRMIALQLEEGRSGIVGLIFIKTGFPLLALGLVFWKLDLNELGLIIGLGAIPAAVFAYAMWLIVKALRSKSSPDESEEHGRKSH